MNRHRYEPVSQRDRDTQPVILSPIPTSTSPSHPNSNNYNFNTGLPSASSIAPSIPTSPPPSFHTISSPGTPRPLPSQELWGVAPSTIGTELESSAPGDSTSNDALATIAGLKQRVEWLEESIGRLLLLKEESSSSHNTTRAHNRIRGGDGYAEEEEDMSMHGGRKGGGRKGRKRHNCCVTFSDASPDMERALSRENNCCVSFKSGREKTRQLRWMVVGCFCFFVAVVGVTVVMAGGRERGAAAVASSGVEGKGEGVLNVRM